MVKCGVNGLFIGVKQFKITRINAGVFQMNGIASDGNFFGFVQRIPFLGMESGKADERQQNQAVL